jgi:hypothetical protein
MASGEPQEARDLGAIPIAVGGDGSPIPPSSIATVTEGAEDRLLRVELGYRSAGPPSPSSYEWDCAWICCSCFASALNGRNVCARRAQWIALKSSIPERRV